MSVELERCREHNVRLVELLAIIDNVPRLWQPLLLDEFHMTTFVAVVVVVDIPCPELRVHRIVVVHR